MWQGMRNRFNRLYVNTLLTVTNSEDKVTRRVETITQPCHGTVPNQVNNLVRSIRSRTRLGAILGERYYVTFALWHESSVCRLSVTLLRPTHRAEVLGHIFAPCNRLGTRTVCIKSLEKFKEVLGDPASYMEGRYEKLAFFYHFVLFLKRWKIRPKLQWKTNRNSYAICDLSNGAISNDLE